MLATRRGTGQDGGRSPRWRSFSSRLPQGGLRCSPQAPAPSARSFRNSPPRRRRGIEIAGHGCGNQGLLVLAEQCCRPGEPRLELVALRHRIVEFRDEYALHLRIWERESLGAQLLSGEVPDCRNPILAGESVHCDSRTETVKQPTRLASTTRARSMQCFLEAERRDGAIPNGCAARLTAFTNQQVASAYSVSGVIARCDVHDLEVVDLYPIPLDVHVSQVRQRMRAGLPALVEHFSQRGVELT